MTTKVIISIPVAPHRTKIEQQDRKSEGYWETTDIAFVEIGETRIIETYIHSDRRYLVSETNDAAG